MTHLRRRRGKNFFFKNSIPKRCSESANSLCKTLQNVQFFGFGQNFRKMAARNFTLGARAAVYRGAAVLFGAEERPREARRKFLYDSYTRAFCAEGAERFFFYNSIPKRRKILYVKLHFPLLNIQFFGFGTNFRKWRLGFDPWRSGCRV